MALGQVFGPKELSPESAKCAQCHKQDNAGLVQQWGESRHFGANIGCFECHGADEADPDAYEHYDETISVLVTPKDCSRCHAAEGEQFAASQLSHGFAGYLKNREQEPAESGRGSPTFRQLCPPRPRGGPPTSGWWNRRCRANGPVRLQLRSTSHRHRQHQ